MPRQRLTLVLLVGALSAGCSKQGAPPAPAEQPGQPTPVGAQPALPSRHFAALLPAETIAYVRLRGANTLKDRLVQPGLLADAGVVQEKVARWYDGLLGAAGRDNPFGLPPETVQEFAGSLLSVHAAVVPADHGVQEPALFLELASSAVTAKVRRQLAERATEKDLQGARVLDLTTLPGKPAGALYVLDETVLVVGPDGVLAPIIAAQTGGRKGSLAEADAFRRTEAELGQAGDLFVYFSADDLRRALSGNTDRPTRVPGRLTAAGRDELLRHQDAQGLSHRAEIENAPFKEIGYVGASAGVDGSLTVRAYTAAGKKLPGFLVRRPAEKRLFRRVPAGALLAYAWTYEGGRQTRKGLSDWLKEEMKNGGTPLVPAPLARLLTEQPERLESDVVVMARDLWAAALPVKTELALALAPDAAGRWGVLVAFDVEDREQAGKLRQQIFEAGKRHDLPWKETSYEGLAIHYLDLEEMMAAKGGGLPPELARQTQLQVGYALSDELFLIGSVEAIKFAHRPSGPVLADVVKRDRIDAANAFHLTFQPGRFLHAPTRTPVLKNLWEVVGRQVPEDTSWSVTLTLEEDRATLRSNLPLAALAAWVGLDLDEFAGALR